MANEDFVPHDQGVADARERGAVRRQAGKEDREERAYGALAMEGLREEVGDADFAQGARVLEQHIASLPADQRARILEGRTKEGTRFIDDPATVRALVGRALGGIPDTAEGIDAELEKIRELRRSNSKAYFADDKMQLKYRVLLRAKGG